MNCAEALTLPPPPSPNKKIVMVSAAALIDFRGKILVAKRPEYKSMAGLWEFPGGKIETGETPEFALMRELREELSIETRPCAMSPVGFTSHSYDEFHLLMPLFAIRVWSGIPKPIEHSELRWVSVLELYSLPMPEADKPLIHQLEAML